MSKTMIELSNWSTLNQTLREADEKMCRELLKAENKSKRRVHVLLRIHGRLNRLRTERERRELMTEGVLRG